MLTRILNSKLPLMVYNPTKIFSLPFFTNIFQSGGLPVFDAEFMPDSEIIHGAKQLEKAGVLFGLRVVTPSDTLLNTLRDLCLDYLDTLIVPVEKDNGVVTLSGFGDTKLILEVKDINMNEVIDASDPHALILKGNEAGGRVSSYSSFILMQWYLQNSTRPVFIHGGVGRNTASGMFAAGVSGIVLGSQLWLADESPVTDNFKTLLGNVEESDSIEVTTGPDFIVRVFAKLGTKIARELKEKAILWSDKESAQALVYQELEKELTALDDPEASAIQSLFFLGQDALFAKSFKKISSSIKEMIPGFFKEIGEQLQYVDEFDPVVPDSPLAKAHGTSFPLIQGPMANISDNADFASQVLKAGALPFLAVGSLPDFLADPMLKKGAEQVKNFGAGLVGIEAFNPAIAEHMEMVKKYKVPFALFAGGIPSQIIELEKAGTKTYLHTPSVSMLKNAIENGCTRFIFEGKEAGGHVGSLSSLVLWDAAITQLLEDTKTDLTGISLIFAGGISTCFASWFISGMGASLAARGAKIGLQVGSAYLFTEEIIETGAMKKRYQEILCKKDETVVIGTSVGLASRTAPTEFARMTVDLEKEMIKQGKSLTERKRAFEKNNIGSLLIGAKGYLPDFKRPGEEFYTRFDDNAQEEKGNFLVGDSLAYFHDTITIPEVHGRYFNGKETLYRNLGKLEVFSSSKNRLNDEIAIVGMGCILPGADNPETLWDNIMSKRYAIKEMPDERIRKDLYYDPDKSAEDKSYTMLAGLVEGYQFDHERFGYSDDKAAKLSRSQKILLDAAYQAVEDAGYLNEDLTFAGKDPHRTAVIIATCLGNELGNELQLKYHFPEVVSMLRKLPEFDALTEQEKTDLVAHLRIGMEGNNPGYDPVHGILLNIEASRVARHLGIRGPNYIVDAACASSFSALDAAVGELLSGDRDQVIVGGVNTHLVPESFVGFCKMGALSADGSFPFDKRANGFILGEGAAVFVLKRMKDALRDGDAIQAVIKGIGSSSDGRGKAIAAPNINGQLLALKRCFEAMAPRITPEDVSFVEAHGTATIMGDQAELETLKQVYCTAKTGISSVKSQIGHLLGGAGAAGLVKAVQAVKKGVFPPNANFETLSPNHDLKNSAMYIIKESAPWREPDNKTRKAGISAYGFGGINYHIVIEEFNQTYKPLDRDIFTDPAYDFNDDRIVIAGLGVRLPGAPDVDHFWEALKVEKKQLSPIPETAFDNAAYAELDKKSNYRLPMIQAGVIKDFKFNNIKYRMPPTTVRSLERGQLLGLDAADEAIVSSGLDKLLSPGNKAGVILGTIAGERQNKNILRVRKGLLAEIIENFQDLKPEKSQQIATALVEAIRARIPENNEDTTPGLLSNIISGRIANHFGLNGANYVIDASCASAVMAINNAIRSLAFKDLDYVLAGGVDANLYPVVLMAFKRLGLLSENTARFFDDRADGYSMGEGAAIHVLTTRKKAIESGMNILGEINHCTVKSSVPDHLLAPSEQTFVSTINECYKESGILKKEIKHLDLFAFSNILGDMVEKQVTEKCFTHELSCGNIKTQFGYFKAANPAVAMAKLVLMNQHRTLLPFRYLDKTHTTLKNGTLLKPVKAPTPVSKREPMRFAFNVNGIGGNHCHVILSPLPVILQNIQAAAEPVVSSQSLAAPSPGSVPAAAAGTGAVYPAGSPRPAFHQPARSGMKSVTPVPFPTDGKHQKMVALLSGQGSQAPGMMKELYDNDPDIRNTMDRGEEIFQEQRGYSLLKMMFGADDRLNLTENTQPAVFLSSAALFDRLNARGFEPDYFIGHSVGEYTALFCSGMLNFDDAMHLVLKRADLMKEAAQNHPGGIMVVFRNEKETATFIRKSELQDIYITNKNSENQTAVSGKTPAIEAFCEYLTAQNIIFKKLNLSAAFHTPLLQEAAEKLRDYLTTITFNENRFGRVISNVTARPYPENRRDVKDLLAKQITSPVEFIRSIEYVYESGRTHYIEIGPGRLLVNLLKNINIVHFQSRVTVDRRQGELTSFEACKTYLASYSSLFTRQQDDRQMILPKGVTSTTSTPSITPVPISLDDEFSAFKTRNNALAEKLLYEEFRRRKREAAMDALERFEFDTDRIVISGVSVGLPGKAKRVFAADNFDRILEGTNFIEPLSQEDKKRITDKNITRLFKQPDGNARFVEITRTEDVIQLAGQLGYFSLTDEYGIKAQYDISMALAVAAGIEALKDAGIPLVMQYKKAASGNGKMIPNGFALPQEMQDDTGVIITSLWPSNETLLNEMEHYLYDRFYLKPYEAFENIYYYLMENVKEMAVKEKLTDWFFKIKESKREEFGSYKFDRNFLMNACPLGSAHLAQIIRAKGPNTLLSSACASTTQAIGVAEDWIRVGRCKRVIVIGGENATSHAQNQWVGSGFLALGAATVKKRVSEAAKPFDAERNGTIIGAGAVGLVIEKSGQARARGMNGQAEILGTHMANSAYHTFNIDVAHMAREMTRFITRMEKRHKIAKSEYARKLLFMSHETYTPARGGSADAEVTALKTAFQEYLNHICISNTKGLTGHTLGAGIEDVVMVKALQKRKAPPIANLTNIPDHFKALNFSSKKAIQSEYGLHLAAGFGSHFAFLFVKRISENSFKNNPAYTRWLQRISGAVNPELKVIDNTLCLVPGSGGTLTQQGPVPDDAEKQIQHPRSLAMPEASASVSDRSDAPRSVVEAMEITPSQKTDASVVPEALPTASSTAAIEPSPAGTTGAAALNKIKEIIAEQTGYTIDMLEDTLDLEADLGIDTVKQVEIFAKAAGHFGFPVPEDLKLRDLNTIAKLADYINTKATSQGSDTLPSGAAQAPVSSEEAAVDAPVSPAKPLDAGEGSYRTSDILNKVKEIIADQTGYTTDMLEDTLDLEADLGIDTVKQVEIFAKAAGHFGFPVPEDLKLRDLNTIAKLADYINTKATPPEPDTPPTGDDGPARSSHGGSASPSGQVGGTPDTSHPAVIDTAAGSFAPSAANASDIKRLVPVITSVPGPVPGAMDLSGKTVIMTLDNAGFARKIAQSLGKHTRLIGLSLDGNSGDFCDEVVPIELSSKTSIINAVERIASQKEIHGFIHLVPLNLCFPDKSTSSLSGADHVHAFYHLMKALFSHLNQKDRFIGVLSLESVIFPHGKETRQATIEPCFAGISGMMKSLAKEMPETRLKMVDFSDPDPLASMDAITGQFLNEICSKDTRVETGYKGNVKYILKLEEQLLDKTGEDLIKKGDTLVVTGGARGITFEILKQVVARYKTHVVILARSPIDTLEAKFLDPAATRATLMAGLRESMPGAKPVALKNETDRIMSVRASRENLDRLRSLGVSVTYLACDVADEEAVQKALSGIDRVNGVIHAAGLEESMPFDKKADDSFARVFNTKVQGCQNLMTALADKGVEYYIGFSSVTARFGNEGQADYTAANDMMAKMLFKAQCDSDTITCKIMDWTAWSGAGMATRDTVKKVLTQRGLKFLPLEEGIGFFMDEMADTVTTEVVITGLDESFDRDCLLKVAPFLDKKTETKKGKYTFSRHLSIERDRFLLDHSMDGTPIFLGATGVEAMAEAAMASRKTPGYLTKVSNFSIPYGIKLLQNRPKAIFVSAEPVMEDPESWGCTITSQFINPAGVVMGDLKRHYQAQFTIKDTILPGERRSIPEFTPVKNSKELAHQIYHPQRLFMDGLFRSIHDIMSFDGTTLVSRLSDSSEDPFFNYGAEPEFLTDVVLLDGMFQTGGAYEFFTDSCVVLPYKIGSLEFMARGKKKQNYLCFTTRTTTNEETDTYDMDLVDESGNFLMKLRDFQMVKLNKLTPEHTISQAIFI